MDITLCSHWCTMGIVLPFVHLSVLVYKAVQHKQWLIFSTPKVCWCRVAVFENAVNHTDDKAFWTHCLFFKKSPQWTNLPVWIRCPDTILSFILCVCFRVSMGECQMGTPGPHVPGLQSSRWHFVLPFALQPACHHALHLFSLPLVFLCCFLHLQKTHFLTLHIIHCWSYWFSVH